MNTMVQPGTRRQLNVGLLWHSLSSDNLGVGALTESQMAIVRAAAARAGVAVRFTVFGTSGSRLGLNQADGVTIGDRFSIKRVLAGRTRFVAQLRSCDLVLDIGEGDSFTDIYGLERFGNQIATKALVAWLGKSLVLSPQTIGPFERGWTAGLARRVMRRATRVYARDVLSSAYLRQLAVEGNTEEAIDVAFRLPYQRRDFGANGKVRVGLNISGLLYAGGYDGGNQFGLSVNYRAMTDRLLDYFTAQPDVELHLVGHVITELVGNEDDYSAAQALAARYPGVVVAEKFDTPSAAKGYIAGLDYFAGARMHACIAAFSSGVAVTPIAYSRKFKGLFSTLGYDQVADCKALTTDQAVALVCDGYQRRAALAQQIVGGNAAAQGKLQHYEDFLVALLESVRG